MIDSLVNLRYLPSSCVFIIQNEDLANLSVGFILESYIRDVVLISILSEDPSHLREVLSYYDAHEILYINFILFINKKTPEAEAPGVSVYAE